MTNEEFQIAVLEKLSTLENEMATKEDLNKLESRIESKISQLPTREELYAIVTEQQKDVIGILKTIQSDTKKINAKIDILNDRTFENEADIRLLKAQ